MVIIGCVLMLSAYGIVTQFGHGTVDDRQRTMARPCYSSMAGRVMSKSFPATEPSTPDPEGTPAAGRIEDTVLFVKGRRSAAYGSGHTPPRGGVCPLP